MDDTDKAEVLEAFPTSLLQSLQEKPETRSLHRASQAWEGEKQSRVELLQAWGYLKDPDVLKALDLDKINLKLLKHTAEVIVKLLLTWGQKN